MQGKNYVEMVVLDNLNLVDLVVRKGSVLSVNVDGGTVYIKALDFLDTLYDENPDIRTGINIIKHALTYPIKQICNNIKNRRTLSTK